jgi:transporter family protein
MIQNYLWIIFALLSAITAALVAIFGKMGLKGIDANSATFLRAVVMAIFLFIVIASQGKLSAAQEILSNMDSLKWVILSGIMGALSWLFYFLALKNGSVQQIVPLDRLSVVFALVLAAIFLGENFTLKTAIGALLLTVGAIIISMG